MAVLLPSGDFPHLPKCALRTNAACSAGPLSRTALHLVCGLPVLVLLLFCFNFNIYQNKTYIIIQNFKHKSC